MGKPKKPPKRVYLIDCGYWVGATTKDAAIRIATGRHSELPTPILYVRVDAVKARNR